MSMCYGGLSRNTAIYWVASRIWRGFKPEGDEAVVMGRIKGLIDALTDVTEYASRHRKYRLATLANSLCDVVVIGGRKKKVKAGTLVPPADLAEYRVQKQAQLAKEQHLKVYMHAIKYQQPEQHQAAQN